MAISTRSGTAYSLASATGGQGGDGFLSIGGAGGDATAMANASAAGGGTAIAEAVATGGAGGFVGPGSPPGAMGAANATSNAQTAKGALAPSSLVDRSRIERVSGAIDLSDELFLRQGSVGGRRAGGQHGDDQRYRAGRGLGSGLRQSGPDGLRLLDRPPRQGLFRYPDRWRARCRRRPLAQGRATWCSAQQSWGPTTPRMAAARATRSATSTFDFGYGGDLMLGLIDDQVTGFAGGLGFQSMELTITANGVELLDSTFRSLAVAESFFDDRVIALGSDFGGPAST